MATFEHNIMHPFNYIVSQPYKTYYTLTGIKCIPGSETGNTYIGHVNVEIGNDPTVQKYNVALRAYHGASVNKSDRIFVAPHIFIDDYLFGGGVKFIELEKFNPAQAIYGESKAASLFSQACPRNESIPDCFTLSGKLRWTDTQGVTTTLATDGKYSYPSSPFYNRIWGWDRFIANNPVHQVHIANKTGKGFTPNQVVFRGLALYHDQVTKKYSWGTEPTGHWKRHLIGSGKKRQRTGKENVSDDHALVGVNTFSFP
jgi:hypothetical protein